MSKLSRQIRNLVFVLVVVLLSFACTIELLQIQIVDGEYYKDQTANTYTANQTVQAARGQIFTKDGKVVNTNRLVPDIILFIRHRCDPITDRAWLSFQISKSAASMLIPSVFPKRPGRVINVTLAAPVPRSSRIRPDLSI